MGTSVFLGFDFHRLHRILTALGFFRLAMLIGSLRQDSSLQFALGYRTHLSYFYLLHAYKVDKFEGS